VRFFVAMFSHETNTFSTIPTGRAQFFAFANVRRPIFPLDDL
jgi:microcystin degradation protein MlrC